MTYNTNKKARKLWSENANAANEKKRLREAGEVVPIIEFDPYMKITIERSATNEVAVFECFEGSRIDNYRVYCNGIFQGVQSITSLTNNIRKALPRFKRIEE